MRFSPGHLSKLLFATSAFALLSSMALCQNAALKGALDLPDAPSARDSVAAPQTSSAVTSAPMASKWALVVEEGQRTQPLTAGEKIAYSFREQATLAAWGCALASAALSHGLDTTPHYGRNRVAFAQRLGAAYARQSTQSVATAGVFSALFHDDPRYFALGPSHSYASRVFYAASRIAVVRGDDGRQHANYPLFAGYAVAAAVNNAYYPERDRTAKTSALEYAASLGGAVLGAEAGEFYIDALRFLHLKH